MSALAGRRECRRRVPSRRGEAVAIGMCGSRAPWLDGGIGWLPQERRCRSIKDPGRTAAYRGIMRTEVPSDQRSDGSKLLR